MDNSIIIPLRAARANKQAGVVCPFATVQIDMLQAGNLWGGEDPFDKDVGAAFVGVAQFGGGGVTEVDDATGKEGAAIIDFDDDGFTRFGVGHARIAWDGHGFVRTGHAVHIVELAR